MGWPSQSGCAGGSRGDVVNVLYTCRLECSLQNVQHKFTFCMMYPPQRDFHALSSTPPKSWHMMIRNPSCRKLLSYARQTWPNLRCKEHGDLQKPVANAWRPKQSASTDCDTYRLEYPTSSVYGWCLSSSRCPRRCPRWLPSRGGRGTLGGGGDLRWSPVQGRWQENNSASASRSPSSQRL